jgi:hypothetical protein
MIAGVAGAATLTLIHQTARTLTPYAPRMDVLGRRAVRAGRRRLGVGAGSDEAVERQAMAGDLVANSAYYALIGAGDPDRAAIWTRGLALGLAAGLGAVLLPRHVGLGDPPNADQRITQLMTIAWYVAGGVTAAAAFTAADPDFARVARGTAVPAR